MLQTHQCYPPDWLLRLVIRREEREGGEEGRWREEREGERVEKVEGGKVEGGKEKEGEKGGRVKERVKGRVKGRVWREEQIEGGRCAWEEGDRGGRKRRRKRRREGGEKERGGERKEKGSNPICFGTMNVSLPSFPLPLSFPLSPPSSSPLFFPYPLHVFSHFSSSLFL